MPQLIERLPFVRVALLAALLTTPAAAQGVPETAAPPPNAPDQAPAEAGETAVEDPGQGQGAPKANATPASPDDAVDEAGAERASASSEGPALGVRDMGESETEAAGTEDSTATEDEQLEGLLADLDGSSGDINDALERKTLLLYGFSDFTFERLWSEGPVGDLTPESSFYVGNLNVYLDAQMHEHWRAMSEIRFTYLPNGSVDLSTGQLVQSTAIDYADSYGQIRTGAIEIERAWLDYSPFRWLGVRGGQWLTPYGIWNVDHGSPTLIGIQKPFITSAQFFPERQTGLMLHGNFPLGEATDLTLYATLSNGRGPIDEYKDLDSNKALGGRAEVQYVGPLQLKGGVSGYRGRFTSGNLGATVVDNEVNFRFDPVSQYDEVSVAADLRLQFAGFDVLGEVVMNEQVYVEGRRPPGVLGLSSDRQADARRWGMYGLAGYTIDPLLLMPYVSFDYIDDPVATGRFNVYRGGLRFTPIASVTLKGEYMYALPLSGSLSGTARIQALRFQAAWAFQ